MPAKQSEAPGWHAIDTALKTLYGNQTAISFKPEESTRLLGDDPLDCVSAFLSETEVRHWYYITYGLSELFQKESEIKDVSGCGFEFTLRIKASGEEMPPSWPVSYLNNLSACILQSGNSFEPGQTASFDCKTKEVGKMTSVLFSDDMQLGNLKTPNGSLNFLQVFPITPDEVEVAKRIRNQGFLNLAREKLGSLLITDIKRNSLVEHAKTLLASSPVERDAELQCARSEWLFGARLVVMLSSEVSSKLKDSLSGLSKPGDRLIIRGADCKIILCHSKKADFSIDDSSLTISLAKPELAGFLEQLKSGEKKFTIAGLPLDVEVL